MVSASPPAPASVERVGIRTLSQQSVLQDYVEIGAMLKFNNS